MKKICISKDWKLTAPNFKGNVDLPNDYAINQPRSIDAPGGAGNGFFQGGKGVYKKYFKIDNENSHYILDIDGAYMCTSVNFNEQLMVMHPHGYTPLLVDLTDKIRFGKINRLEITTNALQPSTRWYSGAGIYRDVYLWKGGDIRLEPRDVFVTTPNTDKISVHYEISSDRDADIILKTEVFDGNIPVLSKSITVKVKKSQKTKMNVDFDFPNAKLWDLENPYLYKLKSTIIEDKEIIDTDTRKFGIRTISADVNNGLLLNGKAIKLRGGCIHHDHGVLGAADYPAACLRKLTLLKNAGFNAIRTAHNPPSEQLLSMCDEMGIVVMDEAFDCWRIPKGGTYNYHMWFDGWWDKDIEYMVKRDRNHPCVFSYSIGNEIPESDGVSDGAEWSKKLSNEIRKYDDTRFVTSATFMIKVEVDKEAPIEYSEDIKNELMAGTYEGWEKRSEAYFEPLDICGYNYMYWYYEQGHTVHPDRVIWGSETQALNFYDSWNLTLKNNYVIGDFTWTAFDNIGEAGTGRFCWERDGKIDGISLAEYPWRTCYQGDFDLCGFRRPQSYFREAVWKNNILSPIFTTHPEHYGEGFSGTGWHWYDVHENWSFEDRYIGKPVKCEVYTDADSVVWYLNGEEIGVSKPNKAIATIDIPYEKGELCAISYKDRKKIGTSVLNTVGVSYALEINAEKSSFFADGRDLCYFVVSVVDEQGKQITHADNLIECSISGGELLGIFSGNPANEDEYGSNFCHLFEGKALAIVKTKTAGELVLEIKSDGLTPATAKVEALLRKD